MAVCLGGLSLILGGRQELGCISPWALHFRWGRDTGGIRDIVCISRVGAAIHHAVRGYGGPNSRVAVGLIGEWWAAEMRGWSEARGAIWLPHVSCWIQCQHLKHKNTNCKKMWTCGCEIYYKITRLTRHQSVVFLKILYFLIINVLSCHYLSSVNHFYNLGIAEFESCDIPAVTTEKK